MKQKLLKKMRAYFRTDKRRIHHAESVLMYAEKILAKEKGGKSIVIPAAILHDIGIHICEQKYDSTNGQLQEKEGPPVARAMLVTLGFDKNTIEEICTIIASHHSSGEVDTLNFKILWDSDWLVNIADEYDITDKVKLKRIIDKTFMTKTGKELAREIYLEK